MKEKIKTAAYYIPVLVVLICLTTYHFMSDLLKSFTDAATLASDVANPRKDSRWRSYFGDN